MQKNLCAAALCLMLAACGGGGSSGAPVSAPVSQAPKCTPVAVVRIQLFGDSTMVGVDGATFTTAANAPSAALQTAMDRAFGMGAVTIQMRAVSGSNSTQLMAGTDGENQPWPGSVDAHIIVVNHGINDARFTSIDTYKADLLAFAKAGPITFLETPLPDAPNAYGTWDVTAFAQAMRDVAAQSGANLIDTNAYFLALPNWQSYLPDGVHPSNEGYGLITANKLIPAVMPAVAKLLCQ